MRHDLLFETSRFNLSVPGAHFINPTCYGEDVAAWLRERLAAHGVRASAPGQEDWGWYLDAEHDGRAYLLGVGGNADDAPGAPDRGEWRVIVEKRRTLVERLTGRGRLADDEPIVLLLRRILEAEPGLANVRHDDAG
jgi:hypothetical protein